MRKHILHIGLMGITLGLLGLLLMGAKPALAANPTTINFQGKVVNANGTNVSDGTYSFVFRIYNTSSPTPATACGSDTACLFEETQGSVSVTNGTFQVELGSTCTGGLVGSNSCTKSAAGGLNFASNNALYLTLQFSGDTSGTHGGFMWPVIHLTSVPYAYYADNSGALNGLSSGNFVQLAQGIQTDSSTSNASIAINKTGATANIITLQSGGTSVFGIDNGGALSVTPLGNNIGTIIRQTTGTATSGNVFDVQTANGSSHFIQITNAAANEGAVTIQSIGATRDLTIDSSSGTIKLGGNSTILQKSATAFTVDINNSSNSLLTVTNAGTGAASLSVESNITAGGNVTAGANSTFSSSSGTATYTGTTTSTLTSATGTTVTAASGQNVTISSAGAGTISVSSGAGLTLQGGTSASLLSTTTSSVTVDSGTTGNVVIGATNNTNAKDVSIGNNNSGSTVDIDGGTGATGIEIGNTSTAHGIEIGTGAAAQTVVVGSTNGASATTIQGGSADITLITSTGNNIQIGSSSTDANITLLVLDSYNTTDPTGTNGAMYYSTNTNKFRCFENGAWKNCIGVINAVSLVAVRTTDTVAIANSETQVIGYTIPAGSSAAGDTYRITAYCTRSGSNASTPTIRVRVGTNSLTGNIAATLTGLGATTATGPRMYTGLITIRTTGASGTVGGGLSEINSNFITTAPIFVSSTASIAVDTTANKIIELTMISGQTTNSYTFQYATIEKISNQ